MDRANGGFLAVVAVPRINKLRVINALISSTPAASTNVLFIINYLWTSFDFVQWRSAPGLVPNLRQVSICSRAETDYLWGAFSSVSFMIIAAESICVSM
jgi:hypothetical protein